MSQKQKRRALTVGISGGSGGVYALRLLEVVRPHYERIDVVFSGAGRTVFREELSIDVPEEGEWLLPGSPDEEPIRVWGLRDYSAPFASGSNCADQMVIVPCSMSTVASIAHGIDQNLMHHAAGVTLKERKDLIVVPRETPLSAVHLGNLHRLAELGVSVIAAMPGFYSGQSTFQDLVDFVVQKVINQLNLNVRISARWGEESQ